VRQAPQRLLVLLVLTTAQGCSRPELAEHHGEQPPPSIVALATHIPVRPAGPILDEADILQAADEAKLDAHLRHYFDQTGNAIIVVSVRSLGGGEIEPYATTLFNSWGIGDAETQRGLLVLVAPNERKVRIEVGCGLEAAITNAAAGQIIEQDMLPHFRAGDLQEATMAGVKALETRLASITVRGPTSRICRDIMRKAA
jgi:uncharacterized protein